MDYMTRAMFGANAVHVPMWMWVQHTDNEVVTFAGASRVRGAHGAHPLRYGAGEAHQFILGEVIVRPHLVFATDAYRGHGISGLLRTGVDSEELGRVGRLVLDPMGYLE